MNFSTGRGRLTAGFLIAVIGAILLDRFAYSSGTTRYAGLAGIVLIPLGCAMATNPRSNRGVVFAVVCGLTAIFALLWYPHRARIELARHPAVTIGVLDRVFWHKGWKNQSPGTVMLYRYRVAEQWLPGSLRVPDGNVPDTFTVIYSTRTPEIHRLRTDRLPLESVRR